MSLRSSAFVITSTFLTLAVATAAQSATIQQALGLKPIQANIDYDQPDSGDVEKCNIKLVDGGTTWVVTDPDGKVLRRFSDSNSDKVIDTWSYFKNGLEVYRDIDADFDGKADQYRWFHSAGTRWAIDEDENGKIDSWKRISPYEVAEVAIQAIQNQDARLYATLLPSSKDIDRLGFSGELKDRVSKGISEAESDFAKFAKDQKLVGKSTMFLDFGASRPAIIPAGGDGVKQDLHVYENVAALVDNGGKPEQVYLGAMVQMGDTWRLIGLPQIGDSSAVAQLFAAPQTESMAAMPSGDAPSEKVQQLLADLEKLDSQLGGSNDQQIAVTKKRVAVLEKLAAESAAGSDREQWQRQQVDMLSAAVQTMQYYDAIEQIEQLATELKKQKASKELQAHVEFRRLWSEYIKSSMDPKSNYTKVRDAWLESLQKFAKDYPNFPDTAEAMLQLGMEEEFAGEEESAIEWYTKLAKQFPNSDAGKKATGAVRRLQSIGKAMPLAGDAVGGGKVNLAGYRRKYVLIHYWATWCEPCKEDIEELKVLHNKYSRRGFDIIGVNLDSSVSEAEKYLKQNRMPWKHVYDEGGLDGRLANEMGVMTLPLMLLVDDKGQVANRNVHITELENELKRVLGKEPQIGRR
ncbi:thioredoxin-like domain-containing protein [Aeoliella sp.]|uniref:thioredoxin-like domain-containing protein n=1 Tax=Aeoliella sp. TaxID=2795800 RepID=UPI003CCC1E2F